MTGLLAVAMITTPVAAAGLLAATAYALATGRLAGRLRPTARTRLVVLSAVTAVAALAVALLGGSAGRATVVPALTLVTVVGLAAVVLVRVWTRRPDLRVLLTAVGVWLGCALVPGPTRLTALLLIVPALALLVGAVLGEPADQWPRFSIAAATAVTVALVSGMVTVLWPVAPPQAGSYEPLARWLNWELEDDVVLSAAPSGPGRAGRRRGAGAAFRHRDGADRGGHRGAQRGGLWTGRHLGGPAGLGRRIAHRLRARRRGHARSADLAGRSAAGRQPRSADPGTGPAAAAGRTAWTAAW